MLCCSLNKFRNKKIKFADVDIKTEKGSKPYYLEHPTLIIAKILRTRYSVLDQTHKEVLEIDKTEEFAEIEKKLLGVRDWNQAKKTLYGANYIIEFAPVDKKTNEYALFAIRPCDKKGNYQEKGQFIDELRLVCVILQNLIKDDEAILKGNDSDKKFIVSTEVKETVNPEEQSKQQTSKQESFKPKNKEDLRNALIVKQSEVGWTGDYNDIDTSALTDLSHLFENLVTEEGESFEDNFNGNVSKWDVANVTDMSYMFANMEVFDCDLSGWNVSNVENMEGMFFNASSYNNGGKPLNWDTIHVYNMQYMFAFATKFQQSINKWDLDEAVETHGMFAGKGPNEPSGAYRGKLPNYLKNDKNIYQDLFDDTVYNS
jgi:surface protein